jgi:hypothetical protein
MKNRRNNKKSVLLHNESEERALIISSLSRFNSKMSIRNGSIHTQD